MCSHWAGATIGGEVLLAGRGEGGLRHVCGVWGDEGDLSGGGGLLSSGGGVLNGDGGVLNGGGGVLE